MKRMIPMTMASSLIAFLLAWPCPAQAQDEPSATQAGGEARFVHHSPQGNQDYVRMFQGQTYDYGEMDLFLRTGWKKALLDLNVNDIRSTNESGKLDFSWGSAVNFKGDVNILTARVPRMPGGLVGNNGWVKDPNFLDKTGGSSQYFKRNFQNEEITLSLPSHPEYRIFAGNWEVQDRGTRAGQVGGSAGNLAHYVFAETVDRFTRENNFGIDLDIADKGQAYYEYAFRKFMDYAQTPPAKIANQVRQQWNVPNQDVNTNKLAFRYNPSAALSTAGGFTMRSRSSLLNGYTQYSYAGNLSAAYRPSKDLSLSARVYNNVSSTKHNDGQVYTGVAANNNNQATNMGFIFLKADFIARYAGIHNVALNAAYKPEYTRRPNYQYWVEPYAAGAYQDGNYRPNFTAASQEDTRHNFEAGMTIEFPKDVELEVKDKYLMANYAAYENMPTRSNEPSATLTVPLPQNLNWTGSYTNYHGSNQHSILTNFDSKKDTFMTGLSWSAPQGKGSAGFYYAFEEGTDRTDAFFGLGGNTSMHEANAPYNYKNHVLSASATAKPMQKLAVTGDASYTDSQGKFLTNGAWDSLIGPGFLAFTPTDARILRFGLIARYEVNKYVSARGAYRRQSWIDRVNSANDGRDDAFDLGLSAKF